MKNPTRALVLTKKVTAKKDCWIILNRHNEIWSLIPFKSAEAALKCLKSYVYTDDIVNYKIAPGTMKLSVKTLSIKQLKFLSPKDIEEGSHETKK